MRPFLVAVLILVLAEPAIALTLRLNVRTDDGTPGTVEFSVDALNVIPEPCFGPPLCNYGDVYLRVDFGTPTITVDLGPPLEFPQPTDRMEMIQNQDYYGVSPGTIATAVFEGERFAIEPFEPCCPLYLYRHRFQFVVPDFNRLNNPNILAAIRAGLVGSVARLTDYAAPWSYVYRMTVESTELIPAPEPQLSASLGIGVAGLLALSRRRPIA